MTDRDTGYAVTLADQDSFILGAMEVRPSLREIRLGRETITIEPRVMQVLVVLGRSEGRTVSRDELVRRCWAGVAVGEDAINRVMTRVRRVAALDGEQSFSIETVPRVGYRLSVPATAGAATVEPEIARSDYVVEDIDVAHPRRRMVLVGATSAIALGAMAAAGFRFWPRDIARPRIAVLPFDAVGARQRSLADGLTDALITTLSGVPEIDVVARSSSFALRGEGKAKAAELLGATHLIDGAVHGEGVDAAASVDLIDAARQTTLWSNRYPIATDTMSALRARIVRDSGTMLRLSASSSQQGAIAPADFQAYLQGQGALLQEKPRPVEAIAMLEGVTARAPSFSPGWTALASARLLTQGPLQPDEPISLAAGKARDAAQRAIETAPGNGTAFALLAAASERHGRWAAIGKLFDRALALQPTSPQVLYRAGAFHADVGTNERAIDLLQRAWRLDPLNADAAFLLLRVLEAAGREDELDAFLSNARTMWRNNLGIWRFAACRAVWLKRFGEVDQLIAAPPEHAGAEAAYFSDLVACTRNPNAPQVARFLAPLTQPLPAFWPIAIFALAMIGRKEECLTLIRRVFLSPQGRAQAPTWVLLQAILQPLWDDLAFHAVLRELGLFDYWRGAGLDPLARNRLVQHPV